MSLRTSSLRGAVVSDIQTWQALNQQQVAPGLYYGYAYDDEGPNTQYSRLPSPPHLPSVKPGPSPPRPASLTVQSGSNTDLYTQYCCLNL